MNKEGVGCKCGWPLDSCNPKFSDERCGKAEHEEARAQQTMNRGLPEGWLAIAAEAFENEVGTPEGYEWPCGSTDEALRPALEAVAPRIEEAVEARVREELLGDEAVREAIRAHGAVGPGLDESRLIDALEAAADAALKPNGAEEGS